MDNDLLINKYKPVSFNSYLGQKHIVNKIQKQVESGKMLHYLFSGNPGLGKSALADVIVNEVFKECEPKYKNRNVLRISTHTVDVLRNELFPFMKTQPVGSEHKIAIIEEADRFGKQAQRELKDITSIPEYIRNCRVILICNESQKIDPALKMGNGGRFTEHFFLPVETRDIIERIVQIKKNENIKISKDEVIEIAKNSKGSPRTALNILDTFISSGEIITSANEIEFSTNPIQLINYSFNKADINKCEELFINKMMYKEGVQGYRLLTTLSSSVANHNKMTNEMKSMILPLINDAMKDIMLGVNEQVAIRSLYANMIKEGIKYKQNVNRRNKNKKSNVKK